MATAIPTEIRRTALDFTSEAERPLVRLGETEAYEMRTPDDFSVEEFYDIQQLLAPLLAMSTRALQGRATKADLVEQDQKTAELLALVWTAPPAVVARIGPLKRQKVAELFIELLPSGLARAGVDLEAVARLMASFDPPDAPPSSGPKPSRGSRGSTGGRRTGGRKSRGG